MTLSPLSIVVHQAHAAALAKELAIPHVLNTINDQRDPDVAKLLAESDVLVSFVYRAAWRSPGPGRLRLVHSTGAGTDTIDLASLPRGCAVCNVYGHERGVAENVFMLMLALQRNLLRMDAALRKGNWTPECPLVPELRGRNLLILGLGHIGQELVRWGRFCGMKITALTRSPGKERGEKFDREAVGRLQEIGPHLARADFVVVAIPAAAGTVDLVGKKELRQMKPTAFIINVGRAPVINEDALYQALQTRRIAGAGLDVWYQYPASGENRLPSRLPFQELDNVIMTPHKPTFETMAYRWGKIADNIHRLARGEALQRVVFTV